MGNFLYQSGRLNRISVPDEAEEEEQEEEFAYVDYLDDPCTCAWSTEDGDISISIDGTFDAESMRTMRGSWMW